MGLFVGALAVSSGVGRALGEAVGSGRVGRGSGIDVVSFTRDVRGSCIGAVGARGASSVDCVRLGWDMQHK